MHLLLYWRIIGIMFFIASLPLEAMADTTRYLDLSLDGLFSGSLTDRDQNFPRGGHDPVPTGFTVQNVETTFKAAVDPFFQAAAHVTFQLVDGETVVELEEAYLTTTSLPGGLEVMAGTFFTRFGRLNFRHPHNWDFADQPLVLNRLFGPDGLRNPGLRVSWVPAIPFYTEFSAGLQNANGETAVSFLGEPGEDFVGYSLGQWEVNQIREMLGSARLELAFDMGKTLTLVSGASGVWGPNATGPTGQTRIVGMDLRTKWQPTSTVRGWPFVIFQWEGLYRNYGANDNPASGLGAQTLRDQGQYAEFLWGFKPGWVLGTRWEQSHGSDSRDPLRDKRERISGNITFYPSEFSKIRLQASRDMAQHLDMQKRYQLILQTEFLIGSHGGHTF